MMSVAIDIEPTFELGRREPLFDKEPYWTRPTAPQNRRIAVSPDGQRFLMLKQGGGSDDDAPPPSIIVVQNWTEELKRLVPTN